MTEGKLPSLALGLSLPVYTCSTQNLHSPGFGTVKDFTGSSLSSRLLFGGEASKKAVWTLETAAWQCAWSGAKATGGSNVQIAGFFCKTHPHRAVDAALPVFPSPSKTWQGSPLHKGSGSQP